MFSKEFFPLSFIKWCVHNLCYACFIRQNFERVNSHDLHWNKEKKAYKLKGLFFLFGSNFIIFFLLGVDKTILHEFETVESESPTLRPCLLEKAVTVPGREATLPAEWTLVSVYMRKKLTPLPEPTVLAHISLSETVPVHALVISPWMSWLGCTSQVLYWEKLAWPGGVTFPTQKPIFFSC